MQVRLGAGSTTVERPRYAWLAVALELFTALGAIPVGIQFLADPSGASMGTPQRWLDGSPFSSYFVPGLYLLFMNGFAMLALAALTVRRHWLAPWLTGTLGVGLIVWILVELLVLPEISFLTWTFLAVGLAMGFVALLWLRSTGQLRAW